MVDKLKNDINPFSDPIYSKLLTLNFSHKKKRVRKKNLKRVGKNMLGDYDYDDMMREIVYNDSSNCPDRPYTEEIMKSDRCRTFYGRTMATQETSKFYSVQSQYGEIIANFSSLYKALYWINQYWSIDCSRYSIYEYPDEEALEPLMIVTPSWIYEAYNEL